MYGLLNSARISTNISLVLDKLSEPSKIIDTHYCSILRLWNSVSVQAETWSETFHGRLPNTAAGSDPETSKTLFSLVCTKNIYKHTQVTVTGKHKESFLYFSHYFGALFNQNYLFHYHNLLSPKQNYNVVTFLRVAMVRWKIIKCRLDGSSASKSSCQRILPSAFGSSAREDAEQGHTQSETRFIYFLNLYLTEAVMTMSVKQLKPCKKLQWEAAELAEATLQSAFVSFTTHIVSML